MPKFSFQPTSPQRWTGRYARIPGETTAFHVRLSDGRWWPVVDWAVGDEIAQCPMVNDEFSTRLASAVNAGKRYLGGRSGGSFLINEFGQVLVPSQDNDLDVALVGECTGGLIFHNSFKAHNQFDLTKSIALKCGDSWEGPYVGIPYNLSKLSQIYFWNEGRAGGWKVLPPMQDHSLVYALREIRPWGAVRFIVTYGGIVLTKIPVGHWANALWEPRFVGRIDYKRWYRKES